MAEFPVVVCLAVNLKGLWLKTLLLVGGGNEDQITTNSRRRLEHHCSMTDSWKGSSELSVMFYIYEESFFSHHPQSLHASLQDTASLLNKLVLLFLNSDAATSADNGRRVRKEKKTLTHIDEIQHLVAHTKGLVLSLSNLPLIKTCI